MTDAELAEIEKRRSDWDETPMVYVEHDQLERKIIGEDVPALIAEVWRLREIEDKLMLKIEFWKMRCGKLDDAEQGEGR